MGETGSTTSGGNDAADDATSRFTIRIPARIVTQNVNDWNGTGSETGSTTTGESGSVSSHFKISYLILNDYLRITVTSYYVPNPPPRRGSEVYWEASARCREVPKWQRVQSSK